MSTRVAKPPIPNAPSVSALRADPPPPPRGGGSLHDAGELSAKRTEGAFRPQASTTRRPAVTLAAALLAVTLTGCISVLPKTKPSQLYRFGAAVVESPAPVQATAAEPIGVFRAGGLFQREAAGDRILTITGDRAAYIAQARWIAPAEVLFDEAVARAFESAPGRVRLVSRGEPARADLSLRLDVRNFETRYGESTNPIVLVRVRAVLVRNQAREQVAEQMFEVRAPAERNRVTAIVSAYNQALAKVLGEIVAWTDRTAV